MTHNHAMELPHIGEALAQVRAAIDVVASGAASQVTVQALGCEQLLPAARALGRAAGVRVEPLWWTDDDGCDIVVSAVAAPAADA
jgi:hypothetical protein